jgi:hypothetical protein
MPRLDAQPPADRAPLSNFSKNQPNPILGEYLLKLQQKKTPIFSVPARNLALTNSRI